MAKTTGGISRYRLGSSYATLVVSISLVLFLLGILGMVLINARQLSDYFRESLSFTIMLKDDAREADIRMLQKELDAKPYVKQTEYVSKDEAAVKLREELGEDFLDFLGYNPLMPTIDVYLLADYTHPDSVIKLEKIISDYPVVDEVYYQESILNLINDNVKKISAFLLIISALLFLIAITIINNTVRLSIYSKRFLINTMQLIGANRSFIRKPFLLRSLFFGFLAALIAIGLLMGLMYLIEKEFFTLFTYENINLFLLLCLALAAAGVVINAISTFFAVNRYLGMHEDKLYYQNYMVAKKEDDKKSGFALGRENYKLMAIGFAIIIVGFILMAGGRSDDPRVFSEDIFSFRRITVAPLIVLAGFVFEIYAIMKKPREQFF